MKKLAKKLSHGDRIFFLFFFKRNPYVPFHIFGHCVEEVLDKKKTEIQKMEEKQREIVKDDESIANKNTNK